MVKGEIIMALPISITPTLKGREAERFEEIVKQNESMKESPEVRKNAIALMRRVLENSK